MDEEWLSFIRNIRNLLVCSCWALSSKTHERNNTRDIHKCAHSPVPENGNGEIKTKQEYVWKGRFPSSPVQYSFAARVFFSPVVLIERGNFFLHLPYTYMYILMFSVHVRSYQISVGGGRYVRGRYVRGISRGVPPLYKTLQ